MSLPVCPLHSVTTTLVFSGKDWSLDDSDAWLYGIVCGWDDSSMAEMAEKHRWNEATVERLKKLHTKWKELMINQ